jgi:hypothetical protein
MIQQGQMEENGRGEWQYYPDETQGSGQGEEETNTVAGVTVPLG